MAGESGGLWPGDVIAHFQLTELENRDSVYRFRAIDTQTGGAVRLAISASLFSVKEARQILAEIHPATSIWHQHVERTLIVGESSGRIWIASELAEGVTLEQLLREKGSLPTRDAARYATFIAAGLRAVHARGLLHLGLKPASVLIAGDNVKVLDVGISSIIVGDGRVFATPTMMAPEQVHGSGKRPDARTDVYALGAILFQMLTGVPPFDGKTYQEVVQGVLTKTPPRLRALKPRAAPLESVVNRALEKKPEARFQSMADLAAALGEVIAAPAVEIVDEDGQDQRFHVDAAPIVRPTPVPAPATSPPTWAFSAPQPSIVAYHVENVVEARRFDTPIRLADQADSSVAASQSPATDGSAALAAPVSPVPTLRADPAAKTWADPAPGRITREVSASSAPPNVAVSAPPARQPATSSTPPVARNWGPIIVALLVVIAALLAVLVLSRFGVFAR
jgi:serine/threonine-protein kinase